MTTKAYIYQASRSRLVPVYGGPEIPVNATIAPPTYPPSYGAVGTYRPSAATTGPPLGTTLTPYNGSLTITQAGTVIDGMEIFGKISVQAPNCTVRRSLIHGRTNVANDFIIDANNANVSNLLLEDLKLAPSPGSLALNGIAGHDFTLRRSEIRDVVDPLDPYNTHAKDYDSAVNVIQNWFHDFAYYTPDSHNNNQTHNDGLQIQGVHNVNVLGNSIEAYFGSFGSYQISNTANPTPAGWPNPDLTCVLLNSTDALGTTQGHVVEDNWLLGGYQPCNLSGAGTGANLGRWWRNKFSGDSHVGSYQGVSKPWTIVMRSDQTIDAGEGTANQNTFLDGSPILVMRNG